MHAHTPNSEITVPNRLTAPLSRFIPSQPGRARVECAWAKAYTRKRSQCEPKRARSALRARGSLARRALRAQSTRFALPSGALRACADAVGSIRTTHFRNPGGVGGGESPHSGGRCGHLRRVAETGAPHMAAIWVDVLGVRRSWVARACSSHPVETTFRNHKGSGCKKLSTCTPRGLPCDLRLRTQSDPSHLVLSRRRHARARLPSSRLAHGSSGRTAASPRF